MPSRSGSYGSPDSLETGSLGSPSSIWSPDGEVGPVAETAGLPAGAARTRLIPLDQTIVDAFSTPAGITPQGEGGASVAAPCRLSEDSYMGIPRTRLFDVIGDPSGSIGSPRGRPLPSEGTPGSAKRPRVRSPTPRSQGRRRTQTDALLSELRGGLPSGVGTVEGGGVARRDPQAQSIVSGGGARRKLTYAQTAAAPAKAGGAPASQTGGGQGKPGRTDRGGAGRGAPQTGGRAIRGPNGPRRLAPSAPFLPADFPVILEDVGGGFTALSPWERERLISRVVPDFRGSLRRLPSGGWLVACASQEIQGCVFRLSKLGHGIEVRTRRPRPVVVGVIRGLPLEEGIEVKVKRDLQAQGLPVDRVSRLDLAGGEPSRSLRVSFFAQKLPEFVRLGSEEFLVSPFVPPVRRCTQCQALGHTKQRCRRKVGRCSRCGRDGHTGADCTSGDLCCFNCGGAHSAAWAGCPEAIVRRKAGEILAARYMPFMEALRLAKEDTGNPKPPPRRVRTKRRDQEERPGESPRGAGGAAGGAASGGSPPPDSRPPWRFGQATALFTSTTEAEQSDAAYRGPGSNRESGPDRSDRSETQTNKGKKKKKRRRKNRKKGEQGEAGGGAPPGGRGERGERREEREGGRGSEGGRGDSRVPGAKAKPGGDAPSIVAPVRLMLERIAADLSGEAPDLAHLFQAVLGLLASIEGLLAGMAARK